MKIKSVAVTLLAGGLIFSAAGPLDASSYTPQKDTPIGNSAADRDTMQKIRKAIMDDKSLSMTAHNVKVFAKDGKVTLRGQVKSEAEKQTVAQAASGVVGADNVTNELTVQPAK